MSLRGLIGSGVEAIFIVLQYVALEYETEAVLFLGG